MAKSSGTKVTRITATDNKSSKDSKTSKKSTTPAVKSSAPNRAATKTKKSVAAKPVDHKTTKDRQTPDLLKPLKGLVTYFKGAWYEVGQVRWPNRVNTWSMTLVLIIFVAVFLLLIIVLDAFFQYLFQFILGA